MCRGRGSIHTHKKAMNLPSRAEKNGENEVKKYVVFTRSGNVKYSKTHMQLQ